jgi:hypothetical protein
LKPGRLEYKAGVPVTRPRRFDEVGGKVVLQIAERMDESSLTVLLNCKASRYRHAGAKGEEMG